MKKMTIKTIAIHTMAMAALALTLGACSENENEMPDTPDKETMTITVSLPGAGTRLEYSEPDGDGIKVKWTAADQIKLFDMDGSYDPLTYSVKPGSISTDGKTATFEGNPLDIEDYYLFGPASKIPDNQGANFLFSFLGQVQIANNNIDHLSEYDFIKAEFTQNNFNNLSFSHQVSIFQFNLTGLPAGVYSEFTIKSSVTDGILYGIRPLTGTAYTQEFLVGLSGFTLNTNEDLVVWVMLPTGGTDPVFKEGTLTLEVTDGDKIYENVTPITIGTGGKTYDAGKRYTMTTAMQEVQQQTELDRFLAWSQNDGWKNEGFTLAESIDLTGVTFTPIGNNDVPFTKAFNGGNFSITGLNIDNASLIHGGLFGYISSTGTVSNLTVEGAVNGFAYLGGIAGTNYGTVSGCVFKGTVNGISFLGGIVGYNNTSTVSGCSFQGTVTGSDTNTGGIVGNNDGGLIVGCHTTQSTITGASGVGGILGKGNGSIVACLADGVILTGTNEDLSYVGGIGGDPNGAYILSCASAPTSMTSPADSGKNGGIGGNSNNGTTAITSYWQTGSGYSAAFSIDSNNQNGNCTEFASGSFPANGVQALNNALIPWNLANGNKCPFRWEADGALPKLVAIQ